MIRAIDADTPLHADKFCSIEPLTMTAIAAGLAPLAGKLFGGGGGSSSGGGLPQSIRQDSTTVLDVVNNIVGSPVNVNVGSRVMPDASLGGQESLGYLPTSQMVSLDRYGSLRGQDLYSVTNEFVDRVANGGWVPPFAREDGLDGLRSPAPSTDSKKQMLVYGLAALALYLFVRR